MSYGPCARCGTVLLFAAMTLRDDGTRWCQTCLHATTRGPRPPEQANFGTDFGFPPYQRHSDTSFAAAESIEPDAATLRGIVLAYLRSRGEEGATDEEMQEALKMEGNTQRPRRRELELAGLVKASGRQRLTRSGRMADVWVAV